MEQRVRDLVELAQTVGRCGENRGLPRKLVLRQREIVMQIVGD